MVNNLVGPRHFSGAEKCYRFIIRYIVYIFYFFIFSVRVNFPIFGGPWRELSTDLVLSDYLVPKGVSNSIPSSKAVDEAFC